MTPSPQLNPIALVGIGCKLPGGVTDLDSYWDLLINKRSGVIEVPAERWDWRKFYHENPDIPGKIVSRWGGFVEDYAEFDAALFGISPREASHMDVQQRWLLETAWLAMQDAGIPPGTLAGEAVGVFVGISVAEVSDRKHGADDLITIHSGTGGALSIAANRLSFTFDLQGPSMAIDTACSSALVAMSMAVRELRAGNCTHALVGGVNALMSPRVAMTFSKATMLSPDGQCHTFDASANGYVRGEGAGMVLLKPLDAALADGDHIYAVVRGTSVNQDGHSTSLTVPSMKAQEAMLRDAYADAGIAPVDVAYIEAHGTGTPVGDPIEAHALGHVLGTDRPGDAPCLVGSVKTNIGHLEPAAGIASLIKACLIFRHGVIPAHLNFEIPNPMIPLDDLGLEVVTEPRSLPGFDTGDALIGVNAFGFGGTNAHVVLQQPPVPVIPSAGSVASIKPWVLPVSGGDEAALSQVAARFEEHITQLETQGGDLAAFVTAAGHRREHLYQRAVVIGEDRASLRARLRDLRDPGSNHPDVIRGTKAAELTAPVFVYTGQGAQWAGMGQGLYASERTFQTALDEIDALFTPLSGWSLVDALHADTVGERIDDTDLIQPGIFAVQVGLTHLWAEWGLHPAAVIGHSVGEVAAAWAAGIYSLEDAVTVIYHRSQLQHRTVTAGGSMAAIGLPLGEAQHALRGRDVQIAAINSPGMVTVAGSREAVTDLTRDLADREVFARLLPIRYAFHSTYMDSIHDDLLTALADIEPQPVQVPFISTVTGTPLDGPELDAAYWWQNVRQPVSFAGGITSLIEGGRRVFVELGPHPALAQHISNCLSERAERGVVVGSLRRHSDEPRDLRRNLAALHIAGLPVDWAGVNGGSTAHYPLPPYPMQRQPFDLYSPGFKRYALDPANHPLLGQRIPAPVPTWEATIDVRELTWLQDHRIWDAIVMPAASFAEIGLALAASLYPGQDYALEEFSIERALFLNEGQQTLLRTVFDEGDNSFAIYSSTDPDSDWQRHISGSLRPAPTRHPEPLDTTPLEANILRRKTHEEFYSELIAHGYGFGPAFQLVRSGYGGDGYALIRIDGDEMLDAESTNGYHFHPTLIDACIQSFSAVLPEDHFSYHQQLAYLPAGLGRLRLLTDYIPNAFQAYARLVSEKPTELVIDLLAADDQGVPLAELRGMRFEYIAEMAESTDEITSRTWAYTWEPRRLRSAPLPAPAFPSPAELFDGASSDAPQPTDLLRDISLSTLQELGWKADGEEISIDDVLDTLGVLPRYRRLLAAHIDTLSAAPHHNAAHTDGPDADLLRALAPQLAGAYRGVAEVEMPPLRPFFEASPALLAARDRIVSALVRLAQDLPANRPLRLLQSGLRDMTSDALLTSMLEALPPHRLEVSISTADRAERRAAETTFQSYRQVEVLAPDALAGGMFDVALVSGLEFPGDVEAVRACLADGGLLISHGYSASYLPLLLTADLMGRVTIVEPVPPEMLDAAGFANITRLSAETIHVTAAQVLTSESISVNGNDPAHHAPPITATLLAFEDQGGLIRRAAAGCAEVGLEVIHVRPAPTSDFSDPAHVMLNPASAEDLEALLDLANRPDAPLTHIVHGWALDVPPVDAVEADDLVEPQQAVSLFGLRLVRAIAGRDRDYSPQTLFISRDACAVHPQDQLGGLAFAMMTGFVRVVNNEHPGYNWATLDLDAQPDNAESERLFHEITAPDGEQEIAYRGANRYVHRLRPHAISDVPARQQTVTPAQADDHPYRVDMTRPGRLSNIVLAGTTRRAPAPDEVEVRVHAAGLNFRDVMKVLGLYPGHDADLRWLGDDIAGSITALGENVSRFKVGDEVVGFAPYGFSSHACLDARLLMHKPAPLTMPQASTIPTTFLTAHYALAYLARLRPGDRVLIHAGAGGVGQAAIQVAQSLDLEIFSTAGSDEKRDFLQGQGVYHVMNSRSLDFADDVLRITNGAGVHAVLNSLAGDYISRGLSVLAPFGHFLEIGKIDVYSNRKLGMEALRHNISLHIIDLMQIMTNRRDLAGQLLTEIEDRFNTGDYHPLPVTLFSAEAAEDAFRYMANAKHTGKIVLGFDEDVRVSPALEGPQRFRPDATYLVVGGTRGFGLAVADWLAGQGVRHLVLMSRSGVTDPDSAAIVQNLRDSGVRVQIVAGDATRFEDVEHAVALANSNSAPLAGVINSVMVLTDDLLLDHEDEDRWALAMWAKVQSGWNLHRATENLPLAHFISFSSISSLFGSTAQSNYSAGNTFLDVLTHYRRAHGLPALAVNFGPLAEAGHLARHETDAMFLDALGLHSVPLNSALTGLSQLMRLDVPSGAVFQADWNTAASALPNLLISPTYRSIQQARESTGSDEALLAQVLDAPPEQRPALIRGYITNKLAEVLGIEADRIDFEAPLSVLGLDSLMSVELVNILNMELSAFNMAISISEVLSVTTIQGMVEVLLRKFKSSEDEGDPGLGDLAMSAGAFDLLSGMHFGDDTQQDLSAEVTLDADILVTDDLTVSEEPPSQLLLTGASGFLGAFILRDLLDHTAAHVTCLVRAESRQHAMQRLIDNLTAYDLPVDDIENRVTAYAGDLTADRFGLDAGVYAQLADDIDTVLHNASALNLLQPYSKLRGTNVEPVKDMLRFAVTSRLKRVHYVSTLYIFDWAVTPSRTFYEDDIPDPGKLPTGYAQSKWVAEQIVRLAVERGIPASIYRPGIITGHSQTGATNLEDLASRVVLGNHQLGLRTPDRSGYSLVPVDYVSRGLVHLISLPGATGHTYHLTHPDTTILADLFTQLEDTPDTQLVTYRDWRAALLQQAMAGIPNDLIPLLPLFPDVSSTESYTHTIDSSRAQALLQPAGITPPPYDRDLLLTYGAYLRSQGRLDNLPQEELP